MSNLGAFLLVTVPLGMFFYVIRGSLVSRHMHAQIVADHKRRERELLQRQTLLQAQIRATAQLTARPVTTEQERRRKGVLQVAAIKELQNVGQPPMPVIQPYYDYPFPATEPPEDQ